MAIAISPQAGGAPIIFDAVVTDTRTRDVDVTEHPVESGANVADHVRPKAQELRIEGVIADHPIPGTPAGLLYGPGEDGRSEDIFAQLEGFELAGTLLRVDTQGKSYSNLVIQALQRSSDKDSADAIKFMATLKEIRIISSQTVALTRTNLRAAKSKSDLGKQSGTPATPAERRASVLAHLADTTVSTGADGSKLTLADLLTPSFGGH